MSYQGNSVTMNRGDTATVSIGNLSINIREANGGTPRAGAEIVAVDRNNSREVFRAQVPYASALQTYNEEYASNIRRSVTPVTIPSDDRELIK